MKWNAFFHNSTAAFIQIKDLVAISTIVTYIWYGPLGPQRCWCQTKLTEAHGSLISFTEPRCVSFWRQVSNSFIFSKVLRLMLCSFVANDKATEGIQRISPTVCISLFIWPAVKLERKKKVVYGPVIGATAVLLCVAVLWLLQTNLMGLTGIQSIIIIHLCCCCMLKSGLCCTLTIITQLTGFKCQLGSSQQSYPSLERQGQSDCGYFVDAFLQSNL